MLSIVPSFLEASDQTLYLDCTAFILQVYHPLLPPAKYSILQPLVILHVLLLHTINSLRGVQSHSSVSPEHSKEVNTRARIALNFVHRATSEQKLMHVV